MATDYQVIRSNRKTVALEMKADGSLLVRAPYYYPSAKIETLVSEKKSWIEKHRKQLVQNRHPEIEEKLKHPDLLYQEALAYLPDAVRKYGAQMGVMPEKIKITSAKKRFGSCSSKKQICFSWRLMAYPQEAIDYVVVHELAHLTEMNHQKKFYELVSSVFPDWKKRENMLK